MSSIAPVPREPAVGSFARGLAVQARVIGALIMRELHTRYGRENVGYVWMFLEPMTLATAVASLHAGTKTHYGSDIQMVPFSILGYTIFIMFRGMVNRADGALESNTPLLYHRSVTVFDMMFARALLEGSSTFVTYLVMMGFATLVGFGDLPYRPMEFMIAVILMFWFSFSLSLLICAGTYENKLVGRFVHPATYIIMPLSGAFFQMAWIPEPYRTYFSWSPLMHIFELLRYGQFQSATDQYVDISYVIGWCLVLTYLGMVSIKIIRRHIHLT